MATTTKTTTRTKTIRYDRSRVPSAWGMAIRIGELGKELRRRGYRLEPLEESSGGNAASGGQGEGAIYFRDCARILEAIDEGRPLTILGLVVQRLPEQVLVRADSPFRSLRDLQGEAVGIADSGEDARYPAASSALLRWKSRLGREGAAAAEIGALPEALEALLRGEIAAVVASCADALPAQRAAGLRALNPEAAGSGGREPEPAAERRFALAAPQAWLAANDGVAELILAHLALASEWAGANPGEALRYAAQDAGLAEEQVAAAYTAGWLERLPLLPGDAALAALEEERRGLRERTPGRFAFDLRSYADAGYLRRAEELIASGAVSRPLKGSVPTYALAEVPPAYFGERKPAHVIRSDGEALRIAKAYADSVRPGASERDRRRRLPFEEVKRLGESGLLGLVVPRAYGGPGVSAVTLAEIFKIVSAADGAIGQIPQNHHFFVKVLELNGTEKQKRFFFAEVLKGVQFGNGLAERGPRTGSGLATRLERTDNGWRVNGSKYFATGSLFSPWIPVFADDVEGRRYAVFIPHHAPGLTVIDDWSGIGQRTTASGSVVIDNVEVPDEYVVPHWKTFEAPQYFGAFAQIMHAAIDVGIAAAAMEDAAAFVRERTRPSIQSGCAKASEEPYLIKRFGELGVKLQAAEALLEKAARAIDAAQAELNEATAGASSLLVASAKAVATDTVIELTNALFEVAGTSSMDEKYNLDRHWRNGRIHSLHDPVRWKLHHVGNWYLNGVLPPNQPGL